MNKRSYSVLSMLIIAAWIVAIPAVYAQTSSGDFTNEPDKTMASATNRFSRGDGQGSRADQQGSGLCEERGDKVAKDSKEGVKKAGDELEKLGKGEEGHVKSGDELKKTFAKVDYELAKPGIRPRMRRRNRARIRAMRSRTPVPGSRLGQMVCYPTERGTRRPSKRSRRSVKAQPKALKPVPKKSKRGLKASAKASKM